MGMILVVTNRQDYTADYLILELQKRGADYVRFNTEDFPQRVQVTWESKTQRESRYFVFPKRRVQFDSIKSVWYRRPVAPAWQESILPITYEFISTESQETLAGVWRTLDCFWVSLPDSVRSAECKIYQLDIAKRIGFEIPATLITNEVEQARQFYETHQGNVVYKPLRHSRIIRSEEVNLIYTNPISQVVSLDN